MRPSELGVTDRHAQAAQRLLPLSPRESERERERERGRFVVTSNKNSDIFPVINYL